MTLVIPRTISICGLTFVQTAYNTKITFLSVHRPRLTCIQYNIHKWRTQAM